MHSEFIKFKYKKKRIKYFYYLKNNCILSRELFYSKHVRIDSLSRVPFRFENRLFSPSERNEICFYLRKLICYGNMRNIITLYIDKSAKMWHNVRYMSQWRAFPCVFTRMLAIFIGQNPYLYRWSIPVMKVLRNKPSFILVAMRRFRLSSDFFQITTT